MVNPPIDPLPHLCLSGRPCTFGWRSRTLEAVNTKAGAGCPPRCRRPTVRLTLPSRGRSKGCAFCPPLMSNVRRLEPKTRMRIIVTILVALLVALLAARVPSFGNSGSPFSWPAFAVGAGMALVASFVGARLSPAAQAIQPSASPLQERAMRLVLWFFFSAPTSLVLVLYSSWSWPIYLFGFAMVAAVISVFFALGVTWRGARQ